MRAPARAGISWEVRISKYVRSDSWCVYGCQTFGVILTIPGGLGVNESDAQRERGLRVS